MKIVGCDLHTRYQQIAMLDKETGELVERRLEHESGEARAFYSGLSAPVRVGIGDAAQIRASVVRKQKTDAWCPRFAPHTKGRSPDAVFLGR
jgi:hypothetical protein